VRILDIQAKVRGALQFGTVNALLIANAQLIAAVAELLAHFVLGTLEVAGGLGPSSLASLLLEAIWIGLLGIFAVVALQRRWLLFMIVQGDIAQLQLAAHVLGILHIHTLVQPSVVSFRASRPAVHDASFGAVTDLLASDLQSLPELVDTAHIVAITARLGRGCNVVGGGRWAGGNERWA